MILPEKDRTHIQTNLVCETDFQRYKRTPGITECSPGILKIPRELVFSLPETIRKETRKARKEAFKTLGRFVYIALKE